MSLCSAAKATLKNRRFWLWQIAGVIIYAIPVAIRFSTGSVVIPILNFPGFWIGHFIPGNMLEKVLVNAFFPGGAGGIAGEVFYGYYKGKAESWKTVHRRRLAGAMVWTAAWSTFQFFGYFLSIMGPYGSNIFEYAGVFPINFVIAALSIFTPDVVNLLKSALGKNKSFTA
jgi:hypothetical protein